ncbi:putative alpha-L-fucosidase [Dioscorea sansibarensis]
MGVEVGGRFKCLPWFQLETIVLVLLISPSSINGAKCILFNFGDSNSDTGGLMAGLGLYLGPPAGRQFFNRTTGRFCDGRLYIDFLCEGLKIKFLSPYLESSGSDYTNGVNFAVAGTATEANVIPFPLSTQVLQFLHFKNRTRELFPQGLGSMISEKGFQNAVYSFDMGQNDIATPFNANSSYSQVIEKIPSILSRIKDAIFNVYNNGGKKFLIYNTGPLGCLPQKLALQQQIYSELDAYGCLAVHNNASKAFNTGLSVLVDQLNSQYTNATFVYVDIFRIKYDLIANHTKYGIDNPLIACCGFGGPPYNYVFRKTCGEPNVQPCSDASRYLSWDGVHNTEAANSIIASKILSGKYSKPQIKLKSLCKA